MDEKINKKLITENIKTIAKWYGVKIGDLEKDAGVSQGYLSRVSKDSTPGGMPLMDLLIEASEKFRVSLDSLVFNDYSKFADVNKRRVYTFFEAVLSLSNKGALQWIRNNRKDVSDEDSVASFMVLYNKDISFFVFQLDVNGDEYPGYSFYVANKGNISKIVTVNSPGPVLYRLLEQVFECAASNSEVVDIDESADRAIRFFMNENVFEFDDASEQKKYRPLYNYLSQLKEDKVNLTFSEMNEILGFHLPASAYKFSSFWGNNDNGQHHHCRAWMDAGYKTVDVSKNLIDQHVFFEKIKEEN